MQVKPRGLILIDTYEIGGAGKVILQFLANGGLEGSEPCVAGFWRGPRRSWAFREAVESLGADFVTLEQKWGFDPSAVGAALRTVRERGIEVIETHGYKAHVVGMALRRMTGIPWVAYVHGWTSENLKVRGYNLLEKTLVRFADTIIPVSNSLASRLHLGRRARRKLAVVANAADRGDVKKVTVDRRESYGIGGDDILVGVIGRFSPEKGHRQFIEAFKAAQGRNGRIRAVFVGDGQERGAIERAISQEGLEGRIILAGFQQDVASFYSACDIIALPSLSEGMPNVALEAMLFAKPVVAFRVGGIPEVVLDKETGLLVESGNTAAFAEAMADLAGDVQRRSELGEAGRQRVALEFCPGKRAERILQVHRQLIAKRA